MRFTCENDSPSVKTDFEIDSIVSIFCRFQIAVVMDMGGCFPSPVPFRICFSWHFMRLE